MRSSIYPVSSASSSTLAFSNSLLTKPPGYNPHKKNRLVLNAKINKREINIPTVGDRIELPIGHGFTYVFCGPKFIPQNNDLLNFFRLEWLDKTPLRESAFMALSTLPRSPLLRDNENSGNCSSPCAFAMKLRHSEYKLLIHVPGGELAEIPVWMSNHPNGTNPPSHNGAEIFHPEDVFLVTPTSPGKKIPIIRIEPTDSGGILLLNPDCIDVPLQNNYTGYIRDTSLRRNVSASLASFIDSKGNKLPLKVPTKATNGRIVLPEGTKVRDYIILKVTLESPIIQGQEDLYSARALTDSEMDSELKGTIEGSAIQNIFQVLSINSNGCFTFQNNKYRGYYIPSKEGANMVVFERYHLINKGQRVLIRTQSNPNSSEGMDKVKLIKFDERLKVPPFDIIHRENGEVTVLAHKTGECECEWDDYILEIEPYPDTTNEKRIISSVEENRQCSLYPNDLLTLKNPEGRSVEILLISFQEDQLILQRLH